MSNILFITRIKNTATNSIKYNLQDIANEIQVIDLDDTVSTSNDLTLLEWADIVIITEPDEIYSLIAAGWMIGRGKHVILVVCNEYPHDASLYSKLGIIVSTQISLLNDLNKIRLSSMNYTKPIDLGLSVLWADRNLDADDTSKPGGYYGWREINGRYYLTDIYGKKVKKFSGWRLPSIEEIVELRDHCKWNHASVNSRWGMNACGPSGESIFLPYSGYINSDWDIVDPNVGSGGFYLSSTIRNNNNTFLRLMPCYRREVEFYGDIKGLMSIRLVKDVHKP